MDKNIQEHIANATIVECNVLYDSPRQTTEGHRHVLKTNGWTFSDVDIMDAEGDTPLPITGGQQLSEIRVGKHLLNYDSMIVLTHFKGHSLAGFGGSLKNIANGMLLDQLRGAKKLPWLALEHFVMEHIHFLSLRCHHVASRTRSGCSFVADAS